jgi:hypothetical protein
MPIREDFITTQYIWALENDYVFVTKAQHETQRNNFYQFTRLVQAYIQPLRKQLGNVPSNAEWAYLYIEVWHRMGGDFPNHVWHADNADKYHISNRLVAEAMAEAKLQTQSTETTEETDMSQQITFKTITYINNSDVTALTDEQLIGFIKAIEREIADLKGVATKSKKIEAKIADAEATLAKVVEVLDNK